MKEKRWARQEECHKSPTKPRCPSNYQHPLPVRLARDHYEESDESESVALDGLVMVIGYSAGGTQSRESRESCSKSSRAVGRLEPAALQHNCTKPQSAPEKPKDSA